MLARRDRLGEKTLLHRGQDHLPAHRALIDNDRRVLAGHPRQAAHTLVLEQVARAQAYARLTRTADHLDGDDRVAAQFEKIVVQADLLDPEHIAPDRRQRFLYRLLRGRECLLRHGFRHWQGLAVELAVGGHRQLVQGDQVGGDHVLRQAVEQPGLEVGWRVAIRHQVRHQLLATVNQHHGFTYAGVLHQLRFNFAQLDAQAAQLDLMIEAAQVFEHAVGPLAHAVAGTVQALPRNERARHKALRRQPRASMITARQAGAAQVQLAGYASGHGVELGVEHIGGEVGDRAANGHAIGAFVDARPVGYVDGGFGRAVEVVQGGVRQFGEHLALRVEGQCLAAAHDALEVGTALHARLMDKRLEHRRHKVQGGDGVLADGLDQARGLAVFAWRGHHQASAGHQRPEELPYRYVKAERSFLQDRVTGIQRVGLLHPAQAVDQCTVAVAGALGLAG
ncbi:hypothetical protein FX985_06347 [Pseudomonas extremaustralis]|uniref:Uncharacterized protein n=1 Tax=Pseudomonas extremaustralis TaxID=359110 RepID=A0A5M9IT56_9PSED|nr:hypothetical protein FX985_06347 [Pseudomonas extremaustralis]